MANFLWHKQPITSVDWHPSDETVLAVASADDSVSLWDMAVEEGIMKVWQPKGVGNDPPSLTIKEVNIHLIGSKEVLVLPVYTNTKVFEIKALLIERLSANPDHLRLVQKQGSSFRVQQDHEEVARTVTLHGIKSFKRVEARYELPHVIIGAGHIGLKLAMTWIMDGYSNFIVFDRKDRVGGTSWIDQANTTSRLQTEVGVYHLQYHEDNDWPLWAVENPWPSRDKLLEHFQEGLLDTNI
eukprot:symbB.v1.2.024745.t1/scaffold2366.1/size81172/3